MPALHLLLHAWLLEEQGDVTTGVGGGAATFLPLFHAVPLAAPTSFKANRAFLHPRRGSGGHLERREALRPGRCSGGGPFFFFLSRWRLAFYIQCRNYETFELCLVKDTHAN